ncbi:MAG: FtsX-like permease family protein [Planctomycetes bacterium]|nr:FtsX-like permease family protein [Planctomycetota bacterium]
MRLPTMVMRNLKRRKLASILTGLSVSLGVGLFATVGALRDASEQGFNRSASVCDMLVGAKGSGLQLTLNALYHMGQSQGNVPYALYEEMADTPGVLWSVPLAVGDSFRGKRIVGVTSNLFSDVRLGGADSTETLAFAEGGPFEYSRADFAEIKEELAAHEAEEVAHGHEHEHDHEAHLASMFKAVVGADVALDTGLKVGSHFTPSHGVEGVGGGDGHKEAETEVVGVLEPTGTPLDRAILIPIGAYYVIDGHEATEDMVEGGTRDPRGLSAVMLSTKAGFYRTGIFRKLNDRLDAQAVYPSQEVRKLFAIIGQGDLVLRLITALIVVVALVGVMVAIYNTMGARRREFATLRALGARRRTILGLVTGESAVIALLGGVVGLLFAGALIYAVTDQVHAATGVRVSVTPGLPELQLLIAVTLAGAVAGLIPALSAYRTEAAHYLSSNI